MEVVLLFLTMNGDLLINQPCMITVQVMNPYTHVQFEGI